MPNVTLDRPLEVSGNERSLTFAQLDPAVSEVFRKKSILMTGGFFRNQPLANGASSYDFPIEGGFQDDEDVEHHVPGQFIEGSETVRSKVNVALDSPLLKAKRIPLVDAELAMWDVVAPAARECARIVARKIDLRGFRVLSNAARTAAVTDVHGGGHLVQRVAASLAAAYPVDATGANNFADDASDLALKFDEADIPEEDRFLFISPYIRQVLTRSTRIMNRDYAASENFSIERRVIGVLEGWKLIMTQNMPTANVTTDITKYNGDFSVGSTTTNGLPAALAMYAGSNRGPIAKVQVGGMLNKVYFDENRDSWLVKCRVLLGLGKVEEWLAGEIGVRTT